MSWCLRSTVAKRFISGVLSECVCLCFACIQFRQSRHHGVAVVGTVALTHRCVIFHATCVRIAGFCLDQWAFKRIFFISHANGHAPGESCERHTSQNCKDKWRAIRQQESICLRFVWQWLTLAHTWGVRVDNMLITLPFFFRHVRSFNVSRDAISYLQAFLFTFGMRPYI